MAARMTCMKDECFYLLFSLSYTSTPPGCDVFAPPRAIFLTWPLSVGGWPLPLPQLEWATPPAPPSGPHYNTLPLPPLLLRFYLQHPHTVPTAVTISRWSRIWRPRRRHAAEGGNVGHLVPPCQHPCQRRWRRWPHKEGCPR
jgi:hypothetical protein